MNRLEVFAGRSRVILQQAWKALALHRLRSFLSVLGIVFAVAAVVAMLAIAEGAKKEVLEQIGRLGIDSIIIRNAQNQDNHSNSRFVSTVAGLGMKDLMAIRKIPGVKNITVVRETKAFLAELGESDVINMLAVNPDYLAVRGLKLAKGRFISNVDVQKCHQVCVLGAELAKRMGPETVLGTIVHFNEDPYGVVGILHSREGIDNEVVPLALRDFDKAAFIPLHERNKGFVSAGGKNELSEIILKISDKSFIDSTSRVVHQALLWNRDGAENFELIVPKELLSQARQTQRLFNVVLGSIAGISLLVGGIGIMNIMLANVSERTREIGIRRAIGATRKHIVVHFLGESILLTVMGGILGIVLGAFAALGINLFIHWRASLTLWPLLSALLMSVAVGIISGIYPAVKAANMEPVEALRHI